MRLRTIKSITYAWISDGNYLPHTLVESFCTAFKKRIYALSGAFQRLFLIQSNPKFSVTDYAELIVKTAKRIQSARLAEPSA